MALSRMPTTRAAACAFVGINATNSLTEVGRVERKAKRHKFCQ